MKPKVARGRRRAASWSGSTSAMSPAGYRAVAPRVESQVQVHAAALELLGVLMAVPLRW